MKRTLLVTGGAGFIGSALILKTLRQPDLQVVNIDKLTYSGNLDSLKAIENHPHYNFIQADIADPHAIQMVFDKFKPDWVMNLAAESHVDRSIDNPEIFIDTNIKGTFNLLEISRRYFKNLQKVSPEKASGFRFLHISTDEVFGDLSTDQNSFFSEKTPYAPSSPYSASKAASDHLVRAWKRTYNLPTLITNCSNNYGPRQFPEKLIPLTILNAISGRALPVYGDGLQIRDWLFVENHVEALLMVIKNGIPGETYTIGGNCEKKNIEVVNTICDILEDLVPEKPSGVNHYKELIQFVKDRPGHDVRYAIDTSKIKKQLGWKPSVSFYEGMKVTVRWYLDNKDWWQKILDGTYRGQRLGLNA